MLRSVVALVCLTLPLAAKAQRVTGTVRLAGADAVLSGVVVSALDAEGRSVGRTLSNEAGRYSLQLTPAAVRLRATRIGFRPADAAIARTGTDLMIDLQMDRAPVVLQTMRISSDASCGTSPTASWSGRSGNRRGRRYSLPSSLARRIRHRSRCSATRGAWSRGTA